MQLGAHDRRRRDMRLVRWCVTVLHPLMVDAVKQGIQMGLWGSRPRQDPTDRVGELLRKMPGDEDDA